MRSALLVLLSLMLAVGSACRPGVAADARLTAPAVPLRIASQGRVHLFKVEVAGTEAEQARGLMFRDHLDPESGMIFPMSPPRMASFWMKNTLIPLDIIFIRSDDTIALIAAETTPYSLEPISSGEPVAAVLEIRGGRAQELGIVEGDRVSWQR